MPSPQVDLLQIDGEGGAHQAVLGEQTLVDHGRLARVVLERDRGMLDDDADPFLQDLARLQTSAAPRCRSSRRKVR